MTGRKGGGGGGGGGGRGVGGGGGGGGGGGVVHCFSRPFFCPCYTSKWLSLTSRGSAGELLGLNRTVFVWNCFRGLPLGRGLKICLGERRRHTLAVGLA